MQSWEVETALGTSFLDARVKYIKINFLAVMRSQSKFTGALDPLLFVDARNHQLAVDIAAPARAA